MMHEIFSPTASCSRGELQAVLAEHRSQLSELGALVDAVKDDQVLLKDTHKCLHNEVTDNHAYFQALREQHEALQDCLAAKGFLKPGEVSVRMSRRRAAGVLGRVLQVPELSLQIGATAGVHAARRLRCLSQVHGNSVRNAFSGLERRIPPDVYVIGGKDDSSPALATVERFSPSTGQWKTLPPMTTARYGCAAAALGGRLYVIGGHDGKQVISSAERFDPSSNRWEPLPPMPTARSRCAAASLKGLLYVIGGRDSRQRTTAAERFDPSTGIWEHLPPLPLAPLGCTAAAIGGELYVIGVAHGGGNEREMAAERFDPGKGNWEALPCVPRQRFGCAAAEVRGSLYVVGGHDGEKAVAISERLDVVCDLDSGFGVERSRCVQPVNTLRPWRGGSLSSRPTFNAQASISSLSRSISSPDRHAVSSPIARGRTERVPASFVGSFQSRSGTSEGGKAFGPWEQFAPMPTARHGCAAVSAAGILYVLGGDDGFGNGSLNAAERYDPDLGSWESLPAVPTGRFGCAAVATWQ